MLVRTPFGRQVTRRETRKVYFHKGETSGRRDDRDQVTSILPTLSYDNERPEYFRTLRSIVSDIRTVLVLPHFTQNPFPNGRTIARSELKPFE